MTHVIERLAGRDLRADVPGLRTVRRAAVLTLLLSASIASAAAEGVRWSVLESTPDRLRVRIDVSGERTLERTSEDGAWVSVRIPGAPAGAEPGQPALPRSARWLALPPEGEANVRVDRIETEDLGVLRITPAPTPRLEPDPAPGAPRVRELTVEGPDYDGVRRTRADVVELGAPTFTRRQRLAPLRVHPVLHDAASGRTSIVRTLELTVSFPRALQRSIDAPAPDPTVGAVLLNADVATEWTTLPPRLRAMREAARGLSRATDAIGTLDPGALLADPIRIRVAETDLYRMRGIELIEDAGLPETITRAQLRLVKLRPTAPGDDGYPAPRLIDVPLHFTGTPDPGAPVALQDEIVFYGLSIKDEWQRWLDGLEPRATALRPDHHNSSNVYFLLAQEAPAEGWARMATETVGSASGPDFAAEYTRVERFEQEGGYQGDVESLDVERYHWNDGREVAEAFGSVRFVSPVPGRALTVRYTLGRVPGTPTGTPFNRALLSESEEVLADFGTQTIGSSVNGLLEFEHVISTDDVADGPALFRVRRTDFGTAFLQAYFGYVEFEYPAQYVAAGDRLRFGLPATAGDHDVELSGFTRSDLFLFDVTDPGAPRRLALPGDAIVADGGGFAMRVRLAQAATLDREMMVTARVRIPAVASLERDPVPDVVAARGDVQVLVVGPEEFRSESERYIAFRETAIGGRDWNFAFYDVQQIYDQFSGGLESPAAIRDFTAFAYATWDATALVLMGDAGEDAREITGLGSPNRVPISTHIQQFDNTRELLASDKWYGIFGFAGSAYPTGLRQTSDVLVGRLPAGDVDELRVMVDKVIAYENPGPDDAWRRRTLWVSDDAYSGDYIGGSSGRCYGLRPSEVEFATSQELSAQTANAPLDGTLEGRFLNLDDFTREFRTGEVCESVATVSAGYNSNYRSTFESLLAEGHLIVSYQGHANYNLLGHESFLFHNRSNPISLDNTGRPFLFFGMGCHVSDFVQPLESNFGTPALGELFVRMPGSGAIATYGSSGFEFLQPNANFMEIIASVMFQQGRTTSPVLGPDLRSQWLLGETLAQAELNTLAVFPGYDEMVSQYNLLGDPLQRLDAAPPRLEARRTDGDGPLADGTRLVAAAGDTTVTLDFVATDESGIDRIVVTDDRGRTWFDTAPGIGDADVRRIERQLVLPIRPQDYTLEVSVHDEAYPALRRSVLTLPVELDLRLFVDGEELADPSTLVLDTDRRTMLEVTFDSPVDLEPDDIVFAFEGVILEGLSVQGGPRQWSVSADALPSAGSPQGELSVTLMGYRTVLAAPDDPGPGERALAVVQHAPVPSPFAERTWITAQVEGTVEGARLTVYDLTGRPLFTTDRFELHDVATADAARRAVTMEWQARDRYGDEVANGTYLYRIEVDGPDGRVRSEMGRVVVMR